MPRHDWLENLASPTLGGLLGMGAGWRLVAKETERLTHVHSEAHRRGHPVDGRASVRSRLIRPLRWASILDYPTRCNTRYWASG
jgi:hypothetical protein